MTSMDLHEFLRTRRSIRRFKPEPVPDSVLERILTTATFAPSAHNRQPWRFVVLTSPESKARLAEAMAAEFRRDLEGDNLPSEEINARIEKSRTRLNAAPVVILLCADSSEMDSYPDTKRKKAEYVMTAQSVANAGLQLLLAAHAEGLGGVWICSPLFAPKAVRTALSLSETWEPQAMFFIGIPAEVPTARDKKALDSIIAKR